MKILYKLIIFILIIMLALYFAVFSKFGNEIAKKEISQRSGINFTNFIISGNKLDIKGNKKDINFDILGTHNILNTNAKINMNFKNLPILSGDISGKIYDLSLNAKSNSFNSNTSIFANIKNFHNINTKIDAKNINLSSILNFFHKKNYANGSINLQVDNDNIKLFSNITLNDKILRINKPLGIKIDTQNNKNSFHITSELFDSNISVKKFNIKDMKFITNGVVFGNKIDEFFNKKFDKNVEFNGEFDISNLKKISGFIRSNIANFNNINYNKKSLSFDLNISNLNNLKPLTKIYINTPFNAKVSTNFDISSINSNLFNGKLNLKISKDYVDGNFSNFNTALLSQALGVIKFYDAVSDLNVKYNIKDKTGEFYSKIKDVRLVKNQILDMIDKFIDVNINEILSGEAFGTINDNIIKFTLNLHSKKVDIFIKDGIYNLYTNNLDLMLNLKNGDKNIDLKISGEPQSPTISAPNLLDNLIDSKKIQKIKNKVNKFLDKLF